MEQFDFTKPHKVLNGEPVYLNADEIKEQQEAQAEFAASAPQRLQAACESAVQSLLDSTAKAKGYDSIFSAVTYADEPSVPAFQQQGQALRAWRSAVWAKCYEVLGAVQAGAPAPTVEQLLAQLPAAPQL